jgi:HAD superfamily hydrolase (TIGR01549 family)
MLMELAWQPVRHPLGWRRLWGVLQHFRAAQEDLRTQGHHRGLAAAQIGAAAARTGVEPRTVQTMVEEWMHVRPLKHLRRCRTPGVREFLEFLQDAAIPAGVLSDYPASAKLQALGLADCIGWSICSTDPDVEAFKPHPRGFLLACERFGLPPEEVLMVGDRADADAAGAAAAGMPCVLLAPPSTASSSFLAVPTFERLRRVLDDRC